MIELFIEVSAAPDEGCRGCEYSRLSTNDAVALQSCGLFGGPWRRADTRLPRCEEARQRAVALRARHRRYADGIAGALREHRAYRNTGEPVCSDARAIGALAQRGLAERATVEWIEKEATELGYEADGFESVPDFMRRVCRERDEARALAGRLVDNGDRP